MPSRRQQVHTYSVYEIESLKGIPTPEKIRCGRCNKNLPRAKYSEKQLTDFRYQVKNYGRIDKPINCQPCTGQRIFEIECVVCHKTKGLEDFAKAQRSKPDTAKCYRCMELQLSQQPVNFDTYEDINKSKFVTPEHSNGYYPDYWSSAESTTGPSGATSDGWAAKTGDDDVGDGGGVSLASYHRRAESADGSGRETLIDTGSSNSGPGVNDEPDQWSEVRAKSWHTNSARSASASANSGFNPNKYGRPSASSNSGTQRTYASSVAERSDESNIRPGGWAKIKAYRPPSPVQAYEQAMAARSGDRPVRSPFVRPAGDTEREIQEAWGSEDDSEEEDEEDSDSDGDNTVI